MRQTRGAVGGHGTNKQKVGHAAIHWPTGVQFVSSKLVYKMSGFPQGSMFSDNMSQHAASCRSMPQHLVVRTVHVRF